MKRRWLIFIFIIGIFIMGLFFLNADEWVVKSNEKNLSFSIDPTKSICVLSEDIKQNCPEIELRSYIGKIQWTVPCRGLESVEGILTITFCKPLLFERYKLYDIDIDLQTKTAVQLREYGNRQIGGYAPLSQSDIACGINQFAANLVANQNVQKSVQQYFEHGVIRMGLSANQKQIEVFPYSGATAVLREWK